MTSSCLALEIWVRQAWGTGLEGDSCGGFLECSSLLM